MVRGSNPGRGKFFFSLFHIFQTSPNLKPASYSVIPGLFPDRGLMLTHSPPSGAEVKIGYCRTSTPPICLRAWNRRPLPFTRVVPKVMSNFFLHANWEQQTKENAVVDGTSCCVILECLVTSIACITWLVSLITKWPTTICRFSSVLSSNSL